MGCNTTNANFFYFQANTDGGINAVALQSTSLLFQVFQNFTAPVGINDAITLWSLMARKLWYSFSPNSGGIEALNTQLSFLRYSIIAADPPLSYIQFLYSGTIIIWCS